MRDSSSNIIVNDPYATFFYERFDDPKSSRQMFDERKPEIKSEPSAGARGFLAI